MTHEPQVEQQLVTAGGKMVCARCTAKSKRTGEQCGRPALKVSKTQKCQFHGGRSTGPKTLAGRQRIARAHYQHGESSKATRRAYSQTSAYLRRMEEAMYALDMTAAPRTRGRKPMGYTPVQTMRDVHLMVIDMDLHPIQAQTEAPDLFNA
jgi:hypothetical protein